MANMNMDFLTEFVLKILEENSMGDLTAEQKNVYVPRLQAQLEERIGLELLPKLDKEQMENFVELTNRETATPEEWKNFWYNSIPNFEEELQLVLVKFAEEVKKILTK